MPDFAIIDSHVHFWDRTAVPLSWLDGLPIDRAFAPADLIADSAGIAIEALVFVEADVALGHHFDEVAHVEALAAEEPRIAAITAHAPLTAPDIDATLARLAARPLVRGIRHLIQGRDAPTLCADPAFRAGLRRLPAHGLHFELCLLHHQLGDVIALVQACPEVTFILDHIAKPGIKAGLREPWWQQIAELAALQNVTCKLSGIVTEADHAHWQQTQIRPYIDRSVEVFGPDRLMFGSDWPVLRLATSYRTWVDCLDEALSAFTSAERRAIFADNARRAYRLP